MAGWHHRLDGHQFGQAPGVGDGQGSLACCSPWGHKELDTTEQLKWIEHCLYPHHFFSSLSFSYSEISLSQANSFHVLWIQFPTSYTLSIIFHPPLAPSRFQTSLSSSNMQTQKPFLHPCVSVQFYPLSSSPICTSPLFPTSSLPTLASPFPSPPLYNQIIWLFQVSTSSPSRFPQTSGGLLFLSLYDNAVVKVTNTFLWLNPMNSSQPLTYLLLTCPTFPGGSVAKNSPANAGDVGSIPGSGRSSGGRHDTRLQYYCLGNPMDRGAWQATVHGVAESQTQLGNWTWHCKPALLNHILFSWLPHHWSLLVSYIFPLTSLSFCYGFLFSHSPLISLFQLNGSQLLGMSQLLIRPKAVDFQIHILKVDFTLGFTLIHLSANRTASWIVNSNLKSHASPSSSL